MKMFLTYLLQSPLIRLTASWMIIAVAGISVFSWRIGDMRSELINTNQNIQASILAIHELDRSRESKDLRELESIIDEIEKYRPTVPDLLPYLQSIEMIAEKQGLDLELHTIKTDAKTKEKYPSAVGYKLSMTSSIPEIKKFLKSFEKNPYATEVQKLDIKKNEFSNFDLELLFILHTRIHE